MHSTDKQILGFAKNGKPIITDFNSDPATFLAGLVVRQSSTADVLSLASGFKCGVSQGRSLSSHKRTSVLRKGEGVAIRAHLKRSTGVITVSSYANLLATTPDTIQVGATTFTAQAGAATLGQAVFRAATSNAATATSLAAQINAHATASTVVYARDNGDGTVSLFAVVEGAGTGNDVAVSYTDNGGGNIGITLSGLTGGKLAGGSNTVTDIAYMTKGAKAYINDTTGKLDIAHGGSTISDAMYVDGPIYGIDEDGAETAAAGLVDMPGGL